LTIRHHRLPVEDGALPLTIAQRERAGAALVIVPSAFGVGPDLEAQMEELAADARIVVALDPFFREDPGLVPYDDMPRVMKRMQALDRARAFRDLGAVIDWVRSEAPGSRVVYLGICFGGPYGLLAAAEGSVDGVVTWHGSRMENYLERASEMRCPMRLHFGSVDPVTPPEALDAIRGAFAGRDDVHIAVHEGATHGFSHRSNPRAYDASAERAGMASVRELVRAG
jgi:carboxymethylenebutenolidase